MWMRCLLMGLMLLGPVPAGVCTCGAASTTQSVACSDDEHSHDCAAHSSNYNDMPPAQSAYVAGDAGVAHEHSHPLPHAPSCPVANSNGAAPTMQAPRLRYVLCDFDLTSIRAIVPILAEVPEPHSGPRFDTRYTSHVPKYLALGTILI
jgi:hypothetical protein